MTRTIDYTSFDLPAAISTYTAGVLSDTSRFRYDAPGRRFQKETKTSRITFGGMFRRTQALDSFNDPTGFQSFCDELSSSLQCPPDGIRVSRGVDGEPVLDFSIAQQNGYYGGVLQGGTALCGSVGGGAISATGAGALVGVPAAVASAGLLTNGVVAAGAGISNIFAVFAKSSSGGSSPGGQSGWSKKEPGDSGCTSGCQDFANEVKSKIGGEVKHITPNTPGRNTVLGQVKDSKGVLRNPAGNSGAPGWYDHYVVVKDGRVYDALTGPAGQTIAEYQARWEYADAINFGF